MDWKQVLTRLTDEGLTQTQIAERCGVAQSTISGLARGATKSPTYELGTQLLAILEGLSGPASSSSDQQPAEPAAAGQGG